MAQVATLLRCGFTLAGWLYDFLHTRHVHAFLYCFQETGLIGILPVNAPVSAFCHWLC